MSLVVASFVCSGLSFLYAGTLAIMRHGTFEDSGVLDSLLEVLVSAVPVGLLYSTPTLIFASPFFSFYLCRQMYLKYVAGVMFTSTNQEGKVFIITGSNTGIGFVTARELVRMGAIVVLACRSIEKANDAKELILKEVKVSETKVMVIQLDLCDFDSVRAFVKAFEATGLPLHCLINNAGVMTTERSITKVKKQIFHINILMFSFQYFSMCISLFLFIDGLRDGVYCQSFESLSPYEPSATSSYCE